MNVGGGGGGGGGVWGACPPENFWDSRCSEIDSEAILCANLTL